MWLWHCELKQIQNEKVIGDGDCRMNLQTQIRKQHKPLSKTWSENFGSKGIEALCEVQKVVDILQSNPDSEADF